MFTLTISAKNLEDFINCRIYAMNTFTCEPQYKNFVITKDSYKCDIDEYFDGYAFYSHLMKIYE